MHFTFSRSSADTIDQYAADVSAYRGMNDGLGRDWGAGRLLPNSSTGKLPGVAQSEKCGASGCGWYELGPVPSRAEGNTIRITGYGVADVESRSQKTHLGALVSIRSLYITYDPDTTVSLAGKVVAGIARL